MGSAVLLQKQLGLASTLTPSLVSSHDPVCPLAKSGSRISDRLSVFTWRFALQVSAALAARMKEAAERQRQQQERLKKQVN